MTASVYSEPQLYSSRTTRSPPPTAAVVPPRRPRPRAVAVDVGERHLLRAGQVADRPLRPKRRAAVRVRGAAVLEPRYVPVGARQRDHVLQPVAVHVVRDHLADARELGLVHAILGDRAVVGRLLHRPAAKSVPIRARPRPSTPTPPTRSRRISCARGEYRSVFARGDTQEMQRRLRAAEAAGRRSGTGARGAPGAAIGAGSRP